MITRIIPYRKISLCSLLLTLLAPVLLTAGCNDTQENEGAPDPTIPLYEGENETYIEASAENSGSILYDKEIRDKPRTRRTKRNV